LLWNANKTISHVRRNGLFRTSRHKFKHSAINQVVNFTIKLLPTLRLDEENIKYIHSVQTLLEIVPHARKVRQQLISKLSVRQGIALKTLLVCINQIFASNWIKTIQDDSNNMRFWSAEDLASAFSFLVNLYREEIGNQPESWIHIDEHANNLFCNTYTSLLIGACHLNQLREAEALIDAFPFEIVKRNSNLDVFSTDELFEKTIRLGYIQHELQSRVRIEKTKKLYEESEPYTVESFTEKAFEAGLGKLFEKRDKPKERFILLMPYEMKLFPILEKDRFFMDEFISAIGMAIDSFRPNDDIFSIPITPTLTVSDIIETQRLFKLIGAMFNQKLKEVEDPTIRELLLFRSVLPVMTRKQLTHLLEFVHSKEKVEKIIEFLTLSDGTDFVDVQYKPFIKIGSYFILPPALIAHSNLIRSVAIENKRQEKSGEHSIDLMQENVVQELKKAGFEVRFEFEFNIEGKRETDILCCKDGHLFIFECKHPYHPCSSHELRTSFEHLKTAQKQLDIRYNWMKNLNNQKKLLSHLKISAPPTENIHTGIITGNRMFSGYPMGQHPVRQAHELVNVISRGEIGRSDGTAISFWKGDAFHSDDLIEYLNGNSIMKQQLESLERSQETIQFGSKTLTFNSYIMDLRSLPKIFETNGQQ
jgi:Holliday junction resolvase